MEAALQLESPAVGVRERLAGFVSEVTERLRDRRKMSVHERRIL